MGLRDWGWDEEWAEHFARLGRDDLEPARIVRGSRRTFGLLLAAGEGLGRIARGVMRRGVRPAVGDWVAVTASGAGAAREIVAVMPRRSAFVRRGAGPRAREQVVAANIDVVLVVTAVGTDLNPRRLERYLTLTWSSGAVPVVVANKIDVAHDERRVEDLLRPVAVGVDVVGVSARTGEGLDGLRSYLEPCRTVALLGSSGVGKSSLVNALAGREVMATREIRERDGRGRHTTTRRELFMLPGGAMVIDTPGMRELGLWDAADGLAEAFSDVEALAAGCRFRNCGHDGEPGCAVRAAVERGELDEARVASFVTLRRELDEQGARRAEAERRASKRRDKAFGRLRSHFAKHDQKK